MTITADELATAYPGVWGHCLFPLCSGDLDKHEPHGSCRGGDGVGKVPLHARWQTDALARFRENANPRPHLEAMAEHVNDGGNLGLAIPPGAIGIDLDDPAPFHFAREESDGGPIQRSSGERGHAIFAYAGPPAKQHIDLDVGEWVITTRMPGRGYLAVWPSRHRTGALYQWEQPLTPIDELPDLPPSWLERITTAARSSSDRPINDLLRGREFVPEGGRHAALVQLAGSLRHFGLSFDALYAALSEWADRYCEGTMPEAEVRRIALDFSRMDSAVADHASSEALLRSVRLRQADPLADDVASPLEQAFEHSSFGWLGFLHSPPPERTWLIPELIPDGVPVVLAGQGGTGKGFLTLNLAISCAVGMPFAQFNPGRPRGVILVSFEDDLDEMHRRLYATLGAMEGEPEWWMRPLSKDRIERNLHVVDLVGLREMPTIEALCDRIREVVRTMYDPGLVIVDPLMKLLDGEPGAVNTQEGGARMIRALDMLAKETGCATLAVHHMRKGALRSADGITGSRSLVDLSRCVMTLATREEEEDDEPSEEVQLHLVKANYSPNLHRDIVFTRGEGGGLRYTRVATREEMARGRDREAIALLDEIVAATGSEEVKWPDWRTLLVEHGLCPSNGESARKWRHRLAKRCGDAFRVEHRGTRSVVIRTRSEDGWA